VQFKDGDVIPADLVVMAAGIRPNTELAEKAGIPCNRGILVNDTMQTYDPRVYSIGECANHRGTAYGLVAPLFDRPRSAPTTWPSSACPLPGLGHLDQAQGHRHRPVLRRRLHGQEGTETITLSDPIGGVYKKLVIKDDILVGGCLYGDTADGGWYFRQIKEGANIAQIRDHLMFGESALGDVGTRVRAARRTCLTAWKSAAATACARAP
jgi:assimilatory nitrite reductase (NAD(P)H) large subunit precursor (EC 1.7.1.4)